MMKVRIKRIVKATLLFFYGSQTKPRTILFGALRGYRINMCPLSELSYIFGSVEKHFSRIIGQYVKEGDNVLDIGANVGFHTLSLSRLVSASGNVFSFEPVPETVRRLKANLELNGIFNVKVYQLAAFDRNMLIAIRVPEDGSNHLMASIHWHKNDATAKRIEVQGVVVDDIAEISRVHVSFVKIDVEGAEGDVIKGLTKLINRDRPVIFMECSDLGRKIVWGIMNEVHYVCYGAKDNERIDCLSLYKHGDFLWVPKEQR